MTRPLQAKVGRVSESFRMWAAAELRFELLAVTQ